MAVSQSILTSTKKLLGIAADVTDFDTDVIIAINTAFNTLGQIGACPNVGFIIDDDTAVWSDYTGQMNQLAMIKSYVFLRAKMFFDPPATSFALDAIQKQIDEYTFRINVQGEHLFPPPAACSDAPTAAMQPTLWNLTGLTDFPSGADIGDWGVDLTTGNIFKKGS